MKEGDFMTRNDKIIQELTKCYDGEKGSLDFTTPFELLIAVMLSAQCTDARVNIVTKDLFKICNTFLCFILFFIYQFLLFCCIMLNSYEF